MDNLSGLMGIREYIEYTECTGKGVYGVKGRGMNGLTERMEISRVVRSI